MSKYDNTIDGVLGALDMLLVGSDPDMPHMSLIGKARRALLNLKIDLDVDGMLEATGHQPPEITPPNPKPKRSKSAKLESAVDQETIEKGRVMTKNGVSVWDVECPKCGAPGGHRCIRVSKSGRSSVALGDPQQSPHIERLNAAREA